MGLFLFRNYLGPVETKYKECVSGPTFHITSPSSPLGTQIPKPNHVFRPIISARVFTIVTYWRSITWTSESWSCGLWHRVVMWFSNDHATSILTVKWLHINTWRHNPEDQKLEAFTAMKTSRLKRATKFFSPLVRCNHPYSSAHFLPNTQCVCVCAQSVSRIRMSIAQGRCYMFFSSFRVVKVQ